MAEAAVDRHARCVGCNELRPLRQATGLGSAGRRVWCGECHPFTDGVQVGPVRAYGPPGAFVPDWATLLVGEAWNRWMQENPGRAHVALHREDLAELCGTGLMGYLKRFARCDLLEYWPGRDGRGSAFPLDKAKPQAELLGQALPGRFRRVVFVGKRVAQAFNWKRPWFEWGILVVRDDALRFVGEVEAAVVPHPSKVSTWWKDPANVAQATTFWTGLVQAIDQKIAQVQEGKA